VWVDGVRAYNRARSVTVRPVPGYLDDVGLQSPWHVVQGLTESELTAREVVVDHLEVLGWCTQNRQHPEAVVKVQCRTGFYVRSLARDVGRSLGVGATLSSLVRTQSHGFALNNSVTVEYVLYILWLCQLQL
jgi:tRNA pseudouridine(55) synthase